MQVRLRLCFCALFVCASEDCCYPKHAVGCHNTRCTCALFRLPPDKKEGAIVEVCLQAKAMQRVSAVYRSLSWPKEYNICVLCRDSDTSFYCVSLHLCLCVQVTAGPLLNETSELAQIPMRKSLNAVHKNTSYRVPLLRVLENLCRRQP